MPASRCRRTTWATASLRHWLYAASSTLSPCARARLSASKFGGRDKLPEWVVIMRSVLRFICSFPPGARHRYGVTRTGHVRRQPTLEPIDERFKRQRTLVAESNNPAAGRSDPVDRHGGRFG